MTDLRFLTIVPIFYKTQLKKKSLIPNVGISTLLA